ncbi:unnamed protein product, partial [Closterium sp. Naga37s-1]
ADAAGRWRLALQARLPSRPPPPPPPPQRQTRQGSGGWRCRREGPQQDATVRGMALEGRPRRGRKGP